MWLVFVTLFLILTIGWSNAACPPPEVVSPCKCSFYDDQPKGAGDSIFCDQKNKDIDLKSVFKRISANRKANEKHFYKLHISDMYVETIESDYIGDLTFEYIEFYHNEKLKRIHSQAFNNTATRLKYFVLYTSPRLSTSPAPYNLFDTLNSFVNAKWIYIFFVNITHVPVFKPNLSLNRLIIRNVINYKGDYVNLTVADRAFYNLDNLTELTLKSYRISHLPLDVFKFRQNLNQTLNLDLGQIKLNSSSFSNGWLNNINRRVNVEIHGNELTYLDRKVFQPFLDDTRNNRIGDLLMNPLNCTDCRNAWLKNGEDRYKKRVNGAHCDKYSYHLTIFDSNFDHCP